MMKMTPQEIAEEISGLEKRLAELRRLEQDQKYVVNTDEEDRGTYAGTPGTHDNLHAELEARGIRVSPSDSPKVPEEAHPDDIAMDGPTRSSAMVNNTAQTLHQCIIP